MKKFIVGSLIAAFIAMAGSAQAVTILEKDNFKYELNGDWQIQLHKKTGVDKDMDVEYDDLELKNHIEYKIDENLTAFGQLDFCFKNSADKSDSAGTNEELEEAYVGLKIQDTKIFMGKTTSAGDQFGVAVVIESLDMGDDCFDKYGKTSGDDIIGLSSKIGDIFSVYATYEVDADSEKSDDNGQFFDIFATVQFSGLTIGAAYQTIDGKSIAVTEDKTISGLQVSYNAGFATFGVDYSTIDDGDDYNESIMNVSAVFTVKTFTIGLGYATVDYDNSAKDNLSGYYANVTYKFPTASNVSVFAEVRSTDDDTDDYEMGYLAGMRLKF